MIRVLRPGLFTTVQDGGRWGYQRFGIPVAGPMDPAAHRLANLLVGNRPSCATLEVTIMVGPCLECARARSNSAGRGRWGVRTAAGPSMPVGVAMHGGAHAPHEANSLTFGRRRQGARAYLAVAGGFDVPPVLGSRATHVGSGMGGVGGRALAAGDELAVGDGVARRVRAGHSRPAAHTAASRVRVLPGPHDDRFGSAGAALLAATRYRVGAASDRMGYRLEGPPLAQTGPELPSAAVPLGAVQVPPSGEPIILMADRATAGGYPRIGTVISADIPVVAQLAPGEWIDFETCSQAAAMQALIEQERRLLV